MAESSVEHLFFSYPCAGVYALGGEAVAETKRDSIHKATDQLLLGSSATPDTEPFITDHGFSLPLELWRASSSGPVVEVGGYSKQGYQSLRQGSFASPCIITNMPEEPKKVMCAAPLRPDTPDTTGSHYLYANGQQLPFRNRSLGAVLMSGLPFFTPATRPAHCVKDAFEGLGTHMLTVGGKARVQVISPRLGSMIEAQRTLQPGGLLIMRWGITHTELGAAKILGFKLKAHTLPTETELSCQKACGRRHKRYGPNEAVWQRMA